MSDFPSHGLRQPQWDHWHVGRFLGTRLLQGLAVTGMDRSINVAKERSLDLAPEQKLSDLR